MAKWKILIVEDDKDMAFILGNIVKSSDFLCEFCSDASRVYPLYESFKPDMILFDRMLDGVDCLDTIKAIRQNDALIPMLIITGLVTEEDVLKGFECGASDYVKKPFSARELVARINAHMRTFTQTDHAALEIPLGNYILDERSMALKYKDTVTQLTVLEYNLLRILIDHKNTLVSIQDLERELWNVSDYLHVQSIRVYISRLRSALSADREIKLINVRASGYILKM